MKILVFMVTLVSLLFSTEAMNDNVKSFLDDKNKKLYKIVAKVDDVIIRQHQVNAQVAAKLQQTFFHKNMSNEKREEYNKTALEELITNELFYAYAKRNKVLPDVEKLDEIKEGLIAKFKTKEEFNQALKSKYLTLPELERTLDLNERLKLIYVNEIKANLTDDDLEAYYEKNKFKFLRPESKKIQLITVKIDPSKKDSLVNAKKKINEAYDKIEKGESFDATANKYSEDMYRVMGGNLGFVHKGTDRDVDEISEKLKKGELSKVIETDIKLYIVKVLDVKPEEQISFNKVKGKLKKDLTKKIEKENIKRILDSQKKFTKVEKF